jgi:aryl-alcohol dehydrogenase-like predicted oxidoreductase
MQYRTLGQTGVQVSSLVLGAMNFGGLGRTTQDEVRAIVDAALEGGINLIDTADMYSNGESEEMVGKAIAGRRDDIVLATKAAMPMGDERNHRGSSRRWLVTELDNSLRRLGVDHLDLYQIHRWDPATSDEETLSALTDLQRGCRAPSARAGRSPRNGPRCCRSASTPPSPPTRPGWTPSSSWPRSPTRPA